MHEKSPLAWRVPAVLCCIIGLATAKGSVDCSQPSGLCNAPFEVTLSESGNGVIYYTTNAADPFSSNAFRYANPIRIATTTVLRARAFDGDKPTGTGINRTFIFTSDVSKQNGSGYPAAWGTTEGQPVRAWYQTSNSTSLAEALRAIPTLSIVANPGDLFSADHGIYANPEKRGSDWARSASIELIDPLGHTSFHQAGCGIRIHGGTSRNPDQSPKHSFRIDFRERYGSPTLRCALFEPGVTNSWTTLVLRAGHNNSWLHPDARERRRADYLRDEWMRRSMHDLGYPTAQGRFVHLYLGGLYWGIYNLCEDPGAWPGALDLRKGDKVNSGRSESWEQVRRLANAGLADNERYQQFQQLVDLAEFTDYMIINLYAGTTDWEENWYAIRLQEPGARYRFFVWDAERTLENVDADILDAQSNESPLALFQALTDNAEYRTYFQKRARLCLEGPLSSAANTKRYRELVDEVQKAIPAEAARWGSYRLESNAFGSKPFEVYSAAGHWRPEVDRILTNYFPSRTGILVEQLTRSGLLK